MHIPTFYEYENKQPITIDLDDIFYGEWIEEDGDLVDEYQRNGEPNRQFRLYLEDG